MNKISDAAETIATYLSDENDKGLLRFITCGSVDDGKSTLIGRLLFDSKMIFEDQFSALEKDSKKVGTVKDGIDFALLVDGLQAEREQGITIDVAYRFFNTKRRKFIVADTPGHEQYTRNMATGASTADLAIILVDARKGLLTQTRRHSFIASLLGVKHVILAVNKMDLVGYEQHVFDNIVTAYASFSNALSFQSIHYLPVSALEGDNLFGPSSAMPWYKGSHLLELLETVDIESDTTGAPFRMPVQWVNRPNLNFRGFSGTIASGVANVGDPIQAAPAGTESTIAGILSQSGEVESASAGDAVTILLADAIDISRGDVLSSATKPSEVTDQFSAHLIWMDDQPLFPGRAYLLKIGTQTVSATVSEIKHAINVNTMEQLAAKELTLNTVAVCNLSLDRAIAFDPYSENRKTGSFILIDRYNNHTVAAGMISFGLRRATNLVWQDIDIDRDARANLKGQKPCVLWFTGLSGSGKSTVANMVERRLHGMSKHTYILDGDNVRHGLNRDLGFTDADRVENIRRVGETAKLFVDAGIITIVSFISPFRSERQMARDLIEGGSFIEVFVDAPLEVCEARDPKGLYEKARGGAIKNFTGIDSPYEAPFSPEIHLQTADLSPVEAAEKVLEGLKNRGFF